MPAQAVDYRVDYGSAPVDEGQVAIREFTDCVVRANPQAVRSMLLSVTASAAETARFGEIMPSLGPWHGQWRAGEVQQAGSVRPGGREHVSIEQIGCRVTRARRRKNGGREVSHA